MIKRYLSIFLLCFVALLTISATKIHPNLLGIKAGETITAITTSLGNPGSDANLPTEKAVRSALAGISGGDTTPAGSIIGFGGINAPNGWLLCQGQSISRSAYHTLFQSISTIYGFGNSSTTFNLPDLRGRFPMGNGQGSGLTARNLGEKPGSETHTLTITEMPSHDHAERGGSNLPAYKSTGSGTYYSISLVQAANVQTRIATDTSGGGTAFSLIPPGIVINYIIKY